MENFIDYVGCLACITYNTLFLDNFLDKVGI